MKNYLNFIYRQAAWLVLLFSISACAYKPDQTFFTGTEAHPEMEAATDSAEIYKIRIGDMLSVKNMQQLKYIIGDSPGAQAQSPSAGEADNQTYLVEPDGNIGLPVIGNVQVAGLTRFAAEQRITKLYSKALIRNPIIQVRVLNLKVSVFGEVRSPGNYPLVQDQTMLTDVLGAAGGLTDKADEKNVKIVRGDKRHKHSFMVDLSKLQTLSDTSVYLQNGDIIYVARNKRATRNDHMQTFSNTIQPLLIVLNTVLIIFTLSKK